MKPIVPPAAIGVLGGGQLGRYAVMAARDMGYGTFVLDPQRSAPAGAVADVHLVADYDDPAALGELGVACDVVTVEFENPPAESLRHLSEQTRVGPSAEAVAIAQDRIDEKAFLERNALPVGPYVVVDSITDLDAARGLDFPVVLKTARLGYDGKGQRRVAHPDDLEAAWRDLNGERCVAESLLALDAEVSIVIARSATGEVAAYPTAGNTHVDGILDVTVVPAPVTTAVSQRALDIAQRIIADLDYVGVLAVEFFVVGDEIFVNEIAPRPHNSGHWTIDAAATSQFAQQIRAICGLPLGDTSLIVPGAAMANLLGDLWAGGEPRWEVAYTTHSTIHLYGKTEPRLGRKMGHLTTWGQPDIIAAEARHLRAALTSR